jgi:hypothetical protein
MGFAGFKGKEKICLSKNDFAGAGGLFQNEETKRDRERPRKERAVTSSFLYFERDLHTSGQVIWNTLNLNSRQMWASCKNGYLRNYRARFKPFSNNHEEMSP